METKTKLILTMALCAVLTMTQIVIIFDIAIDWIYDGEEFNFWAFIYAFGIFCGSYIFYEKYREYRKMFVEFGKRW